mgnify:CR=1 FL=1
MMQKGRLEFKIGIIVDDDTEYNRLMKLFSKIMDKAGENRFIYQSRRAGVNIIFNVCLFYLGEDVKDVDSQLFILKSANSLFYLDQYFNLNISRVLLYSGDMEPGLLDLFLNLDIPIIPKKLDDKEFLNLFKKFVSLTVSQRISREKFDSLLSFFKELSEKTIKDLIKKQKNELEDEAEKLELKKPIEKFFLALKNGKLYIAREYLSAILGYDIKRGAQISDIYSLALSLVPKEKRKKLEFELVFRKFLFESLKVDKAELIDIIKKFLFSVEESEKLLDAILVEFETEEKIDNIKVRYFYDPRFVGFSSELYIRRREEYYKIFNEFIKQDEKRVFVVVGDAGVGKSWFLSDLAFTNNKIIPLKVSNDPEYEVRVIGDFPEEHILLIDSLESAKNISEWERFLINTKDRYKIIIACRFNDWMYRKEIVSIRRKLASHIFLGKDYTVLIEPFNEEEFEKVREKFKVKDESALRMPYILGVFLKYGSLDEKTIINALISLGLSIEDIALIKDIFRKIQRKAINPDELINSIGKEKFRKIMSLGIFYVKKTEEKLIVALKDQYRWLKRFFE